MMFRIMVLQALYSMSDDQAEFQIQDRLSFMRSLALGLGDRVPDAKTIWLLREHLTQARAVENLFARFDKHLTKARYLAMGGQIVDAMIVAVPKQRNTDAEKADIKAGKVPDAWKGNPAKLRQKDQDARWTVKFSRPRSPKMERRSSATSPLLSATTTTPPSIAATSSSAAGTSRARQPMTGAASQCAQPRKRRERDEHPVLPQGYALGRFAA
ncbi:MAG: transposase [Mesorhizobium sp.]|nr:MAG: transposase [Mesorhizobium sp.]